MSKTNDIIKETTQAIVDAMKDGGDWSKPWKGVSGFPNNPVTGTIYQGGNAILLMVKAMMMDAENDSRWSTYNGWQGLGAQVQKGEKATKVLAYRAGWKCPQTGKWSPKRVEGWKETFYATAHSVFHASQTEGAPVFEQPIVSPNIDVQVHREWFQSIGADWREVPSDRAFYKPSEDYISTPEDVQFKSATDWFGVIAHEFTHWTGADGRLNRINDAKGNRTSYAFEELVAELGAAFLSIERGVETTPRDDHSKYIKSWLSALGDDPKFIWDAAGKASKAMNFLTSQATS
tara:strand:- start:118 stop:987 length:870 start_codon:yes stop_codon:yes gene_type:complete